MPGKGSPRRDAKALNRINAGIVAHCVMRHPILRIGAHQAMLSPEVQGWMVRYQAKNNPVVAAQVFQRSSKKRIKLRYVRHVIARLYELSEIHRATNRKKASQAPLVFDSA